MKENRIITEAYNQMYTPQQIMESIELPIKGNDLKGEWKEYWKGVQSKFPKLGKFNTMKELGFSNHVRDNVCAVLFKKSDWGDQTVVMFIKGINYRKPEIYSIQLWQSSDTFNKKNLLYYSSPKPSTNRLHMDLSANDEDSLKAALTTIDMKYNTRVDFSKRAAASMTDVKDLNTKILEYVQSNIDSQKKSGEWVLKHLTDGYKASYKKEIERAYNGDDAVLTFKPYSIKDDFHDSSKYDWLAGKVDLSISAGKKSEMAVVVEFDGKKPIISIRETYAYNVKWHLNFKKLPSTLADEIMAASKLYEPIMGNNIYGVNPEETGIMLNTSN